MRLHFTRPWAAVAGIVLAAGIAHGQNLFGPAEMPADFRMRPEITATHPTTVNLDLLSAQQPGGKFTLNLMPGVEYTATVHRVERRGPDSYTVAGRLAGFDESLFVFCVEQDVAAMMVDMPVERKLWRTRYGGGGVHVVCSVDARLIPPCDGGVMPPAQPALPGAPNVAPNGQPDLPGGPGGPVGGDPAGVCSAPQTVFDVLIVYTDDARVDAGGTAAIQAECQLAIETTNEVYANSGILARCRLVWRGEGAYTETGSFLDHLNRITNTSDGILDWVHTRRDDYNCDLVALLVEDTSSGGIAWCQASASSAFSVTRYDIASSAYVFAHEIGHNQGCAHDRQNVDCSGSHSYSYGWRFFGNDGTQYRTVMSYAPGSRIPYFSNPNRNFQGQPTGVPIGQTNESYNVNTINIRRGTIEGFEATRFDIWVDFGFGGPFEFGIFSFPYNTLAEGVNNIGQGVGASELPTLWIKEGQSNETRTISDPMQLKSCGGIATIGGTP